jgi:hypothetical protein
MGVPGIFGGIDSVMRELMPRGERCMARFGLLKPSEWIVCYGMSRADLEQIALKLPEIDRALLAAALLETVGGDCLDQAADEAERRERELDNGEVTEISREELLKRVEAERRR